MNDERDRDLRDVMREERSRGRKQPVHTDAERRQAEEEQAIIEVLRGGDESRFRDLLRLLDFSSDEIEEKVKAFRAARAELSRRAR